MLGDEEIMASDEQIRANRLNAQRSTGPRSENGKQAVRYNALQHGLLAEASLLPGEDTALFRRLAEELQAQFEPAGELEQLLVDRITSSAWRLRRVLQVEAGLFVARLKYALPLEPKHAADEQLLALQQAFQPLHKRSMMTGTRRRCTAHPRQTVSAPKRLARSGGLSASTPATPMRSPSWLGTNPTSSEHCSAHSRSCSACSPPVSTTRRCQTAMCLRSRRRRLAGP